MTTGLPEETPTQDSGIRPVRCLILANSKAGTLRSLTDKLVALIVRCLNAVSFQAFRKKCEDEPECIQMLAEAAAASGMVAHVESIPPQHEIPERVRSAEQQGFDVIVAAGGDGTVHSLLQGIVGSQMPLGMIPMGTANNVARALGIPLNIADAMSVISQSNGKRVDVGRVAGHHFLEAAGVGLFADAFAAFGKDEPRKYHVFRLLKVLGPMLWNPPIRNLQLTIDGVVEADGAVWIAVSNSAYIGDNLQLAPGASLEDGLFDVIIVGALGRHELVQFAFAVYRGKHLDLPKVRRVNAKTIGIQRVHRGHKPLPVHADAEIVGYTPTLIETIPAAIEVIVP